MYRNEILKYPSIVGCIEHTESDEWSQFFLNIAIGTPPEGVYIDDGYLYIKNSNILNEFSRKGIKITDMDDSKKLHDTICNFIKGLDNIDIDNGSVGGDYRSLLKGSGELSLNLNNTGEGLGDKYFPNDIIRFIESNIKSYSFNQKITIFRKFLCLFYILDIYNCSISKSDIKPSKNGIKLFKKIQVRGVTNKFYKVDTNDKRTINSLWLKYKNKNTKK